MFFVFFLYFFQIRISVVFSQELKPLRLRALDYLEPGLIVFVIRVILAVFLLFVFRFVFVAVIFAFLATLRVCNLLVVDTVVKLAIVVELVLAVDLPAQATEAKNQLLVKHHRLDTSLENLHVFALGRVERSQDNGFLRAVLQSVVNGVNVVLSEAVYWILVFISVVTTRVVVSVFLLYHLSFLVVEKLKRLVIVLEPRVSKNLFEGQSLVRVYFQEAPQDVPCILRNVVL